MKYFNSLIDLYSILRKHNISYVHSQDSFSSFYALPICKITRIPLINSQIQDAGVSKGLFYFINKLILKSSDIIIANSQAGLNYYCLKKGFILYNLINRNRFTKTNGSLNDIIMNANFHDYKDHLTFIKAMKRLYEMNRVHSIGLIGDGPNKKVYEGIVNQMGLSNIVRFYGHIQNVEEVLVNYGIGVLSSTKKYREGLPNVLLEYIGAELIAVGSDVGGTNEIIKDNITGFLFDVENPDSLIKKIIYIQDNETKMNKIRSNALEMLENQHSPIKNTLAYKCLVTKYIDGK